MRRIGVVTGLAAEGRCLPPACARRCAGADPSRAAEAARALLGEGCDALMSFGLAGGLDPTLPPGTLLVPETVVDIEEARLRCHEPWRRAVVPRLAAMRPVGGALLGTAQPVLKTAGKAALFGATGAAAVDTESRSVAAVAAAAQVPFLAVRVIADPAAAAVPAFALAAVRPDGTAAAGPVLRGLVRRPSGLPAILALAWHSRTGLRALRRAVAAGILEDWEDMA